MKTNTPIVLLLFLTLATAPVFGQNPYPPGFPGFETVEQTFFEQYDPGDTVFVDLIKNELGFSIVIRSGDDWQASAPKLFWSAATGSYLPLNFSKGYSAKTFSNHSDAAECNRQPFFGYLGWQHDAIAFFEKRPDPSDDELNAYARAYASYAQHMTRAFQASVYQSADSSQVIHLDLLHPRFTADQAAEFSKRMDNAIRIYREIEAHDPGFMTPVGPIDTKIVDEIMYKYMWLSILYDEPKARAEVPRGLFRPFIRESAYNLLQSCPPDAILMTYGDTDTYSALYLQLTEGVRPDVLVVNISLLLSPYYNRHLSSDTVIGALPPARTLPQTYYDQVPVLYPDSPEGVSSKVDTMPVGSYFRYLKDGISRDYSPYYGTSYRFPGHYLELAVDQMPEASKLRLPSNLHKLGRSDRLHVKLDPYVLPDFQTIVDWTATNGWKRPVCFALTCSDAVLQPFGAHLVQQGMVYRLYPVAPQRWNHFSPDQMMDLDETWRLWQNTFQWDAREAITPYDGTPFAQLYFITAIYLSRQFSKNGDYKKAKAILDDYCRVFSNDRGVWDDKMVYVAKAYATAKQPASADKVLITLFDNYTNMRYTAEQRTDLENNQSFLWDVIREFELKKSETLYQSVFKN